MIVLCLLLAYIATMLTLALRELVRMNATLTGTDDGGLNLPTYLRDKVKYWADKRKTKRYI